MSDLTRLDPRSELEVIRNQFSRLFRDFPAASLDRPEGLGAWLPRVDIKEDAESIRLRAELPGLTDKDVEITLEAGRLTIRGEKKTEKEWEEGRVHLRESASGTFLRSFVLPEAIKPDEIEATVKNGVLEVTIPKAEVAKAAKIEVKAG